MGGNELKYVEEAFNSNYIAPVGTFLNKFEEIISKYAGVKYAAAVSSGTAAIHLALESIKIKKGDIVLSSTFTFIGSVSPILFQNAIPYFIDSDLISWNIDPNLLEDTLKKLKLRGKIPKALIVTHLYGQPAVMNAILEICKKYNIFLIEDAAESLGATFGSKHTGTFGDMGIYSFNGNKIITTSGGGMLVSNNKEYIDRAKFLATQAREECQWYEHNEIGYNYRMSNIIAAIGVGQMEVLNERIKRKREIFDLYRKYLSEIDEITFMPEIEGALGNRWLTTLIFKKTDPLKIINELEKYNIESRPLWKPMHIQPALKHFDSAVNGTSEKLFRQGICLPSGTALTDENIKEITDIIKNAL